MKAFSFIHTADLHLDSPFKGISEINERVGSELAQATFKAFDNIIQCCIDKQVDFFLISGDIYDSVDKSLIAQLRFLEGLKRLSANGIAAYITFGNHDPINGWSASLDWPENVHIFKGKSVETFIASREDVPIAQISGISYDKRDIKTNLVKLFPDKSELKDLFTIGMLHCNVGSNVEHEPYAPCTLEDLIDKQYNYWALGHIHRRSILNPSNPLIIYPGSPQGLNPKEIEPRGCYFVSVDQSGKASYEFVEVDSVRWFIDDLPINTLNTDQDLITLLNDSIEKVRQKAEGRSALYRIRLSGRGPLYESIKRQGCLEDLQADLRVHEEGEKNYVWIESLVSMASPEINKDELLKQDNFIGDLLKLFEETSAGNKLEELRINLEPLFTAASARRLLNELDDEHLIGLLKKAEEVCLDKFTDKS